MQNKKRNEYKKKKRYHQIQEGWEQPALAEAKAQQTKLTKIFFYSPFIYIQTPNI